MASELAARKDKTCRWAWANRRCEWTASLWAARRPLRMMWIPKPIYEALPYVYGALGVFFGYVSWQHTAGWMSAFILLVGAGLLLVAMLLWLRRRDFRDTQKHYNVHSLDD